MFANVIINVSSSNVDVSYDYIVPENMSSLIKIGCRVKVPFGPTNRALMGYVISLSDETGYEGNLKEIIELVDIAPVISSKKIELAKYIKEDTICPLIRILNLFVPEILQLKPVKYLKVRDYNLLDARLANLFSGKEIIEYNKKIEEYSSIIKKSIDEGILEISYDAIGSSPIKYINKYILNEKEYFNNLDNLRSNVVDALSNIRGEVPLTKEEIIERCEISNYFIEKCIKLGILKLEKVRELRIKVRDIAIEDRFIKENKIYDQVVETIQNTKNNKPLLWVPSNVDEQLSVIERIVRKNAMNGKNILIVCPDILSSYRYSSIIKKNTKLSVACLNSDLSRGEYFDYSEEILKDEYRVIVSTPKGSMLEIPNLETIILVDSENENYFNDQSPRYDLKKVMYVYSKIYNVNYVMQSFSPSIDDYINGIKGKFEVIDNRDLIEENLNVEVVDLKEELLKANNSLLSQRLVRKIKLTKAVGKQTLIICNRKYHSNFVMCRSCGEIVKCPKCDVALKYSQKNNSLLCPACSYKITFNNKCNNCSESAFRYEGSGIEQLIEDLNEVLPDFKVTSIVDSNYEEFSEKMYEVEENKIDIIISTNVFSHSIIEQNIGLVCIINLDEIMGNASFISNERTFNMLSYIKAKMLGKVDTNILIQTYNPNNFVLNSFITNDYKEYIKTEINNRKTMKNTPFYDINRVFIKGKYEEVFKEANNIKKLLQELAKGKIFIIGPTYNKVHQAVQIIVKHQLTNIFDIYRKIYEHYQFTKLTIIIDKYPRYL